MSKRWQPGDELSFPNTQKLSLSQVREGIAQAAPELVMTQSNGELRIAPRVDWLCTSGLAHNAAAARTRAESIAYYTTDREDAINTARLIARDLRLEIQRRANAVAIQESPQ
jgi:hypothetical protein